MFKQNQQEMATITTLNHNVRFWLRYQSSV